MRPAVAIAAAASLALAAPAQAQIVIGRSIHGLELGATEARFRAVLGAPDGPRDYGEEPSDYGLTFRDGRYHGLFETRGRRASLISTTSSAQRTASGVGPGVSARFARARLHGERCSGYVDEDRGIEATECAVVSHGTETDFDITFGRVFEVVLSRR